MGQLPAELRRSLTWTADWRWPNTKPSPWRRICRFTSAIRKVHGSVAPTKTPTAYCGNICQRTPTYPGSRDRSWTRSLCDLIPGHDKPWDFELRRINCRPVSRRPLETTRLIVNWLFRQFPVDDKSVFQALGFAVGARLDLSLVHECAAKLRYHFGCLPVVFYQFPRLAEL